MLNATEMLEGSPTEILSEYKKSPAFYLYPWVLASIVWMKSSGSQSDQIPFDIPVVQLYDFSHPNKIPGKDCPFAIDGERYYFTKQVHRDASGKRSKRKAGEQGDYWKSTSKDIDIKNLNGKLIGYMRKYTLCDKNGKRSANWCMEEYRAHNHHELDDPYVLCKIYEKKSVCSGHTGASIRDLTNRAIKRKRGSQPDQTNSVFDNMSPSNSNPTNPLQTQFDNKNIVEDPIMQQTWPTYENFPPNSPPIPRPHDASENQNRPESIPPIPLNGILMNQSQTQFDNYYFDEDLTLPTSENFLSNSIPPTIPCSSFYSNESPNMIDASISWPSMPPNSFENLSAPDGEESPPDLWHH